MLAADAMTVDLPLAAILLALGAGLTGFGVLGWRGVIGRRLPRGVYGGPGTLLLAGVSLIAFGVAAFLRDGLGDVGGALSRLLNAFGFLLWVLMFVNSFAAAGESFPDRWLPPHHRRTRR